MTPPKTVLALAAALAAATLLAGGVPASWTVDVARPRVHVVDAYHGETLDLAAAFQADGKPLEMPAKDAVFCWQTNGMADVWWKSPATAASNVVSAVFTPKMDPGAPQVVAFLGVPGQNWRAELRIRFRSSPGATVNDLPLPAKSIDFAQVEVENAPWIEKETDPTVPAWAKAAQKPSYTAAEVGALASTVTHLSGDVPTTRKVNGKALSADITLGAADVGAYTKAQVDAKVSAATPGDYAAVSNKALSAVQKESDPTVPAWAKAAKKPSYTAAEVGALASTVTHLSGDVPTTRKVNGKALSADITLGAADVGAYTKAQVDTKGYVTKTITNGLATAASVAAKQDKPVAPVTASALTYRADCTAISVAVPDSATLSAQLTGWTEGQAQTALISLASGSSVASGVRLVGYGDWPTNRFVASCVRVGDLVYVTPITLIVQ